MSKLTQCQCIFKGSDLKMRKVTLEQIAQKREEIINLEEPYAPHPLAGVMAQNKPAAAKEKHVWSTGDQKIGK